MKKVCGYVERKTMLYVTGVEYGDYTMNHVLGCAHGCIYPCYAFLLKKRFGLVATYEEWVKPYLVKNTLDILQKEIPKLKNKIKSVQLCFTTDPFMFGYDEISEMSLAAIDMLNSYNIKCTVLTKGILPESLSEYSNDNEFGITLVSLDNDFCSYIEPGAAPCSDRLNALKILHGKGCKTWVSMEPYPTPNLVNQDICCLLESVAFVDKIIFGRTNYNKSVTAYKDVKDYYDAQSRIVIEFCESKGIKYHIKNGTMRQGNSNV
ncbi:hypothetical protein LN040_11915 [Desulfovibrio subterraneus]|uniref:radical SAM protein n=1 Tax=Desulfovibrio subterraneus TaxID=2718620 RepID=UPI0022B871D6|nr:radical SAM protein [Desulfovibrio subterraneus]WBF66436.1 hypothetical protein LN040_11915 [Desulfovibrio subterraneus]